MEGPNALNHFINITTSDVNRHCQADVGYKREPGQMLNLNQNCMKKGVVMHEVLHSLGFYHQHSATNRHLFVEILEKNVRSDFLRDLLKVYSSLDADDLGFPYDYDSIMHYGPYDGGKNELQTIKTLQPGAENMGQRTVLSPTDVNKINKMYSCTTSS